MHLGRANLIDANLASSAKVPGEGSLSLRKRCSNLTSIPSRRPFRSGDAGTRRRASTTVCFEVILGPARTLTGGGIVAALTALGPARAARARYAHSLGTACAR